MRQEEKSALLTLRTVAFSEARDAVIILDQTQLPAREVYVSLRTAEDIWEAIYHLKVRGAPAIGIAAAYGIAVCMSRFEGTDREAFIREFKRVKAYLASSRPTAVNLSAALERMERALMKKADGHLAVSEYGTALAPIYLGEERGYGFKVFVDETRPLLQGARLTAYELSRAGVDATLICDNMASLVMSKGWVQAVVVGCDRVAANGDVANKIGTSGVAILAHHYGIPFYVLGPTSTIDTRCATGADIVIEERDPKEITDMWYAHRMAPDGIKAYNPSFDVTPHELISAIITEKGVYYKNI